MQAEVLGQGVIRDENSLAEGTLETRDVEVHTMLIIC